MHDTTYDFDARLKALGRRPWYAAIAKIARQTGFFEELGDKHAAAFIDQNTTLLVTFESRQGIQTLSDTGQPLGFDIVDCTGWSHLALISEGDTWFRTPEIYDFFDELTDDGFFDGFEHVVFYGAGPCGYAAAAYSVAAPGACVLAIAPQATLDPRLTSWDERFFENRALDFTSRYGYAPKMLDAARSAYVIYDPHENLDAMHAVLFQGPATTLLRVPHLGDAPQTHLLEMGVLHRILLHAGAGTFTPRCFACAMRARRDHLPYLRTLLTRLDQAERPDLAKLLCAHVTHRMHAPRFAKRLDELSHAAG